MTTTSSCCAPSGPLGPGKPDPASPHGPDTNGVPWPGSAIPGAGAGRSRRQKVIPSGSFQMGDQHDEGYPADGEVPVHEVRIDSFRMDETAVTNAQFATFCKDTGYVTEAEQIGVSAVFHLAVDAAEADVMHQLAETPWWVAVKGANWRHPGGPRSSITDLQNHPVVHVSWNDAMAYCLWSGTRLPTEAEWEYASRGGLQSARFPWGDELTPRGRWNLNVWQGRFPTHNSVEDGYLTTAPVRTFRPNDFGLYQMVGNVWEWCADRFDPGYY
ncbi:MAG TPA: formylglycine-generating enzyme family protein, partial [Candidatus Dietzia merdigallinarum]|nr:formylglycine-generating enzyme family protein [Candidatus Dietzia merdigallinarum]